MRPWRCQVGGSASLAQSSGLHKCPWGHSADRWLCIPQTTATQLWIFAHLQLPICSLQGHMLAGDHAESLQLVGCRLACCMTAKQLRAGHSYSQVRIPGIEGLPPSCSAGVDPLWMPPVKDTEFGVAHHVKAEVVEATLNLARQGSVQPCSAVLITSPTYYGACSDMAGGPPCQGDVLQHAGSGASLCACFARNVRQF